MYVIVIIVVSPGLKAVRSLAASPVKARGNAVEVAAAPVPNADMMRPPKSPLGEVEDGEDALATHV